MSLNIFFMLLICLVDSRSLNILYMLLIGWVDGRSFHIMLHVTDSLHHTIHLIDLLGRWQDFTNMIHINESMTTHRQTTGLHDNSATEIFH